MRRARFGASYVWLLLDPRLERQCELNKGWLG